MGKIENQIMEIATRYTGNSKEAADFTSEILVLLNMSDYAQEEEIIDKLTKEMGGKLENYLLQMARITVRRIRKEIYLKAK